MLKHLRGLRTTLRRLGVSLRVMAFLFCLNMVAIVFEVVGVAMLLPILELLQAGGSVDSVEPKGKYWGNFHQIFSSLGLPMSLGTLLVASFSLILVRQGINYLNVQSRSVAMRTTSNKIRQRAFQGYLSASTALQEESRIGDIAGDLTVELPRALSAIFAIVPAAGHMVQMAAYVGGLLLLSAPMTFIAVGIIGLAVFLMQGYLLEVKRSGVAITDSNRQLAEFIVERLKHVRLIRLSATEKAEAGAFAKLSQRHALESLRQSLIGARISLLPEPLMLGFGYLVLFIGGQILGLGLDLLALFVVVLIRLLPVMRGLAADYNAIVGKWPSVEKLDRQLKNILKEREDPGGDKRFEKLEDGVVYEHVSFSYGRDHALALRDVSVALPVHRMSGLVGPSGAGKSTFVDLLPRLRDPTAGRILFDGVPITEFTRESLRSGIAFVPQQAQIFNSTVAEHIRYGKDDATEGEVREAARLAGALSFIEALPRGFETTLGEKGLGLSVGQRQRLDIARALVRHAPILVLDEPTSALDAEAEDAFRDALRTLRANTNLTIIVIAHRLSSIIDAELIVVLKDGRVEAVGSHEALLAAGGWYARAFEKQSRNRPLAEVNAV